MTTLQIQVHKSEISVFESFADNRKGFSYERLVGDEGSPFTVYEVTYHGSLGESVHAFFEFGKDLTGIMPSDHVFLNRYE